MSDLPDRTCDSNPDRGHPHRRETQEEKGAIEGGGHNHTEQGKSHGDSG